MTTRRVLTTILVLGLLASLLAGATLAQEGPQDASAPQDAVGDAFTYQGRLTDGGSPANGIYDFLFSLFDQRDTGSVVGSTINVADQTVTDGLFTVELDFGDVFDGKALWLEIHVRPGDSTDTFTKLWPRQPLTATPYALSLRPGAEVRGTTGSILKAANDVGDGFYALTWGSAAAGMYGVAMSNSGEVYGVRGESISSSGYGVYGEAPQFGVYGEASRTSNYAYGVYGKTMSNLGAGVQGISTATSGSASGVFGSADSASGYAGYFSNDAGGVDIMAAGSGVIKSSADSVLYLSPHDMVVRGSSGVSVTPLDNGGADIHYTSSGWKYISLPVSTFGTLFGSPLHVKAVQVCYKTDASGYIGATTVIKNNGGTGATNYILSTTDRTSSTHACYTVTSGAPAVIDNSTWVQFNVWSDGTGHTYIYTVDLTLTETP